MRIISLLISTIFFILVLGTGVQASTEAKIALVIGSSNYKSVPLLRNPANDAKAIASSPKEIGFSTKMSGDTFKDCDVCPEIVVLPAGSFMIGSHIGRFVRLSSQIKMSIGGKNDVEGISRNSNESH